MRLIIPDMFFYRPPVGRPSDSMILLGSIERLQLQSLLSLQLSVQRRLEHLQHLAHNNGTQDHLPSLTSDSTPSSPSARTHIDSAASADTRQAVRFLVSSQQVGGIWGGRLDWAWVQLVLGWEMRSASACVRHVALGKGTDGGFRRLFW